MTADEWKAANPFPVKICMGATCRNTTQAEYDAMAIDRAAMLTAWETRRLAGQAEIEALGFTVAQVRTVYGLLKTGAASPDQAQKALAGVMKFLWKELLND